MAEIDQLNLQAQDNATRLEALMRGNSEKDEMIKDLKNTIARSQQEAECHSRINEEMREAFEKHLEQVTAFHKQEMEALKAQMTNTTQQHYEEMNNLNTITKATIEDSHN